MTILSNIITSKGGGGLLAELTKNKCRKKSDGYGDLYGSLTVAENEKPLLMRRLHRVFRGFNEYDLKKNNVLDGVDNHYDRDTMVSDVMCILELQHKKIFPSDIDGGYLNRKHSVFDSIMLQNEALGDMEMTELTVRALNLLTIIVLSIFEDTLPEDKIGISCEITDDKIITYIRPSIPIDKDACLGIKSVLLSRIVGAKLESDGEMCCKVTVSRLGEYLYEVRRTPDELSEEDGEEFCEEDAID